MLGRVLETHAHRPPNRRSDFAFQSNMQTKNKQIKSAPSHKVSALPRPTLLALLLSQLCAAFAASPAHALDANALPANGVITQGSGTISQVGGTRTQVQQTSERMVANWSSFNIGSNAAVQFIQPSARSVALNRVTGSDPSQISGQLTANGQVFLLNPNGIVFGNGARVDVGGIVATSLSLSDDDFLARR
jgi:filamentous hemagglutinin family protein